MKRCEKCLHWGQETMSDVGSCNCCDNGEFFSPMPGYHKFEEHESYILEPEDWTQEEWVTLCKLWGLPANKTERIVVHATEMECFIDDEASEGAAFSRHKAHDASDITKVFSDS